MKNKVCFFICVPVCVNIGHRALRKDLAKAGIPWRRIHCVKNKAVTTKPITSEGDYYSKSNR